MITKVKLPRCLAGSLSFLGMVATVNAAVFFEDFQDPPSTAQWSIHGDPSFFQWDPEGHLDVVWDSSQTNSYFIYPLRSVLGRHDDFELSFELVLESITYLTGGTPPSPFEIAIGWINRDDATDPDFLRGEGTGTVKNLVELDYFPDTGFGNTLWPAIWSTNATLSYVDQDDYVLTTLPLNRVLAITMDYNAADEVLTTTITADGEPFLAGHPLHLAPSFTDFRVDAFSISSYHFQGDSTLRAQGRIDNIRLTYPLPVNDLAVRTDGENWFTTFTSRTNWTYQLEETTDLDVWSATGSTIEGTGDSVELSISSTEPFVFTRVRAVRR